MNELNLIEIIPKVDIKVIKETLTRIGICNKKTKTIYPTCYLYENYDKYYIVHFKEMFLLTRDNSYNNLSEMDTKRKNAIAFCLKNWGLIDTDDELIADHNIKVDVIPHKEKKDWKISHKFNMSGMEQKI